jgi:hypothetical protein
MVQVAHPVQRELLEVMAQAEAVALMVHQELLEAVAHLD